jgi:hypothetical protein
VDEARTKSEREPIAAAAEAQEVFGDDELERYADEARRRLDEGGERG